MANKYEQRRRALKDSQGRGESSSEPSWSWLGTPHDEYVPPLPMDRKGLTFGLCTALVLLVVALYGQTANHKFTVCDDNVYIYKTPMVVRGITWEGIQWAMGDAHAGNWHPLTWMSHMLDCQLFGQWDPQAQVYVWDPMRPEYAKSWPGGHHLVSMALHCANAVLLLLAMRLLTGTLWPCVVVAVLFAIHPLRAESVAWAAERKDVLCGLFWTSSMLAYAWYVRRRPIFQSTQGEAVGTFGIYLIVTLLFGLGLMAKSMIVSLPCVFLLLDIWPLDRWRKALGLGGNGTANLGTLIGLILEKIPWFAMVLGDCYITVYGQHKGVALNSLEGLPMGARIKNAIVAYGEYLRQTVWPTGMAPFYAHPHMIPDGWNRTVVMQIAVYGVLLAIITVGVTVALFLKPKWSFLAVGWFWYLGALVPVIGLLQVGTQARADRYTYLPMIGVYIMVAWLLKALVDRWPETRVAIIAECVAVLLLLSIVTFRQVSYWHDSYKLFEHAVKVTDNNYFAYNHIGIQYDEDGMALMRTDAAAGQKLLDLSAKQFAAAVEIKPDYDFGNNNLGVYYARLGEKGDLPALMLAEKYFRFALMANFRYADAYNNLGIVLAKQGKFAEAVKYHLEGLKVQFDRASDHNNLGRVYMQIKEFDKAEEQFQLALTFDPNFVGALFNLGQLYCANRETDKAIACLTRLTLIDPSQPDAFFLLATQHQAKGDLKAAEAALLNVLKLNPQYPKANEGLSEIRAVLARGEVKN